MQIIWTALLLASSALALPANPNGKGDNCCTKKSSHTKKLTVKDFDFHASYIFSTPAHQNSWGYVNFGLYNPNTDYQPSCNASSNQLSDFFYGNVNYKCTDPSGYETTFSFSRPNNDLRVNQTWACKDEGSHFTAHAGALLKLDCKETKWQNPDWKPGQFYSTRDITCTHVDRKIPITDLEAVA
ncbi:uncharacterized protein GIQ15_01542 [Arthroderma uncinatum]|uniref:uncharacterized protein n=1 Tax=Arthroderma uncinatum TaxID=74035 RepID=UPI00144ADFD4|nr:uncharacterized protein GIQ15_01542 [Arthroderma uncinatum]KAF3492025.1 hypothetical protein GIQ15_01542 [Arthroderma uncinatum]